MLNAVRAWILLSALLVSSGWILSACRALDLTGYLATFALAGIALAFWRRKQIKPDPAFFLRAGHKLRHRFKRLAPLLFLVLGLLALAAGILHPFSNFDANAYRTPRVLHWLGQGQWHWIRTYDQRMNIADCGFEWLSAPLILFTRTDRFFFLINWVSYLMLPGLFFSVFTRLRVRPRVAWWWMWILSSGWCFAFQAGSDVNDSFAAIYALAAVDLALRAREKNRVTDLWLSMLAAALVTGAKQIDIPLALLWLIAAWPAVRLGLTRPAGTLVAVIVSLLVSALPVSLFNIEHFGTWFPADRVSVVAGAVSSFGISYQMNSPFWAIVGNAFCLPVQNLLPPFFPYAGAWNEMMQHFVQTPLGAHFRSFQVFGYLSPGVSESTAGIGLGICVLTLISLLGTLWYRRSAPAGKVNEGMQLNRILWLLRLAPWALLLLFMAKNGTDQNARQLAPYYAFFFPVLLINPGNEFLVRRGWWQRLGLLLLSFTGLLLMLAPGRPVFPARAVMGRLQAKYPHSKFIGQTWHYVSRVSGEDRRNFFKKNLPAGETVLGYAAVFDADEPGLWLPDGQRRVERLLMDDTPERLHLLGIHFVVVEDTFFKLVNETPEEWMNKYNADLVNQLTYTLKPGEEPKQVYLVRVRIGSR
jgi:hypothetical protein